jgi:peptidoglycan/xylan/chitin deacetylase (PgdA/CDA1 family)
MISTSFKVLPWNGYRAALSLTFDDGDPSQLDFAIPEMEKRGIRGSFYLVVNRLDRVEEWKKASRFGHELGNHSLTHRRASTLAPGEAETEVGVAKQKLEETLGVPIETFVYPYSEVTPALRQAAEKHHFITRCGLELPPMTPESDPDWAYLPSLVAWTYTSAGILKGWANTALQDGGWTLPMFHSFDGTKTGWQPMARKVFIEFLDFLAEEKDRLWLGPVREVGAYWMAQKTLERTKPRTQGNRTVWKWQKPGLFPGGTRLKVLPTQGARLEQGGQTLQPAPDGTCSVSFDAGELTLLH